MNRLGGGVLFPISSLVPSVFFFGVMLPRCFVCAVSSHCSIAS